MRVTLTFDNGPSPGTTDAVLDELAARQLPATFFVVGSMLDAPGAEDLLLRTHAEGHAIGNHSMTHRTPLGHDDDPAHAAWEVEAAQARIDHVADERRLFRPFGLGGLIGPHLLHPSAVDVLTGGRYTCVLWTSVPRDWEAPEAWVDAALADVRATEHSVVVLHDLPTGAMAALPRFLDELASLDAAVTNDLPPAVLPIERGEIRSIEGLVPA